MNAEVTRLDNGFTVATETMSDLKSVAIALYVQAGSRHERNDQGGIAHFLEHMAFKGTKTRTASQISNTIENVGGMLNAYTSRDKTAYLVRVLSEDIAIATELLADIILNSIYDPKEIDLERKVILNEIRQYRDYPEDVVFEELQKMVYPDQPFGRPIIGTADLVSNYSRNDLKGYISEHYHPNKMILAVAGGIKHDEVTQLAEKFFGNLESKKTTPFEASSYQSGEYRKHKEVEQTQFVMAFHSGRLLTMVVAPTVASAADAWRLRSSVLAATPIIADHGTWRCTSHSAMRLSIRSGSCGVLCHHWAFHQLPINVAADDRRVRAVTRYRKRRVAVTEDSRQSMFGRRWGSGRAPTTWNAPHAARMGRTAQSLRGRQHIEAVPTTTAAADQTLVWHIRVTTLDGR